MKIAFLFREPVKVPLNLREYYISRELKRRGHGILWIMLVKAEDDLCDQVLDCSGFKIVHLDTSGCDGFRSLVHEIRQAIRDRDVELVWVPGWFERWPRYLFLLFRGLGTKTCRVVYDPIDPIYEYVVSTQPSALGFFKKYCLRLGLKWCYRQCQLIFAVTSQIKQSILSLGIPENRIEVAMWGTDIERFNFNKLPENSPFRDLPQLKNKFVIGWLGTMSRFKGIEEILVPLLKRLSPLHERIAFLLAGSGPLYDHLAKTADTLPSGYVTVFGSLPYDQAPAFTAALDCYLVPTNPFSLMGNLIVPVKIFDALVMGVPVITTRSDAIEAVADGLKGVTLVDWGIDQFYEAVVRVIENHEAFKQIAIAGAEAAGKPYY